jgi:hypothetical protein
VSSDYSLYRPLPPEIRTGVHNFFIRYKDYPVFSWGWWWRRFLLSFLAFFVLVFATTFASWIGPSNPWAAAQVALLTFISSASMVNIGTGLAAVVRHRRLPERWAGFAIVLVILFGAVASFFVDELLRDMCISIMRPFPEAVKLMDAARVKWTIYDLVIRGIYLGLLGGLWAVPAYFSELRRWNEHIKRRREAELLAKKHEADLRLSVLQAQVEPHFLFNTLASVRALIRQDPQQSEATLDALVEYLRSSIPKLRENECAPAATLGQQLDLCAHYLEVMRMRTAGRLQYMVDADADARALSFPPMLLITLVENAIKHGIEPKPGPGRVTISAARENEVLRVSVVDDGLGLRIGVGGGLGLANVRAQLDALYGKRATFEICGLPAQGVRAELRIPLQEIAA